MAGLKPQKAPSESITDEELDALFLVHPYLLGSPKLDGYRCLVDEIAKTSSMKPVTNKFIQDTLSKDGLYEGLDGELLVGAPNDPDAFSNTTGAVRRSDGEPDFKLYVYDEWPNKDLGYIHRTVATRATCKNLPYAVWVLQVKLINTLQVKQFEDDMVKAGYEGAMIRTPEAKYKYGRATLLEGNIFKRKPFEDSECTIIGFEEQMQNNNKKTTNELGKSVRSAHKANKTGKGTLGKFLCHDKLWKKDFKIATCQGLTDNQRQIIWNNQDKYLNRIMKYKYQRYGSIDAPRIPIGMGFRDPSDMTDY